MSSLPSALLPCLFAAIALGCGSTTASGGAADANGDIGQDSGVTDATLADTGGCLDDGFGGCSGLDVDTADAKQIPDSVACEDFGGCPDSDAQSDSTSDTGASTCPPVLVSAQGAPHGKACTQDSDCSYGLCQKGGFLTGYNAALGYCTKDCGCSQATAQCSDDNAGSAQFSCSFEVSQSGGNTQASDPPQKRCALQCKTDADCSKWNPALPHCIGSSKYVSSSGVCGFDPFK